MLKILHAWMVELSQEVGVKEVHDDVPAVALEKLRTRNLMVCQAIQLTLDYLSCTSERVLRYDLQLIGTSCMMLVINHYAESKEQELVSAMSVEDCRFWCADTYTDAQFRRCQAQIERVSEGIIVGRREVPPDLLTMGFVELTWRIKSNPVL
jgi:hypothetical protein